jgi:hypothetical protein
MASVEREEWPRWRGGGQQVWRSGCGAGKTEMTTTSTEPGRPVVSCTWDSPPMAPANPTSPDSVNK